MDAFKTVHWVAKDVVGDPEEADDRAHSWQAYIDEPAFKTAFGVSSNIEPYNTVYSVKTLSEIRQLAMQPVLGSVEDIKGFKK